LLKDYIKDRVIELSHFIIETRATVRQGAKKFGISKSTVHKDVSERLQLVQPNLVSSVREVLDENKSERHIRGGNATKDKYLHLLANNKNC